MGMSISQEEKIKKLMEELSARGFVLVGVPEISGGSMIAVYYDADNFERIHVRANVANNISVIRSGQIEHITKQHEDVLSKVDSLLAGLPAREEVEPTPEDLEAARLVREVRTLRLTEKDRLVLILKDLDVLEDRVLIENLRNAVERWLGEKNSRKVMIMAGDVQITKLRSEDNE